MTELTRQTPVDHCLFLWGETSGYMAACWRELAMRNHVSFEVVALDPYKGNSQSPFPESIVDNLPVRLISRAEASSPIFVRNLVAESSGSTIVVCGWNLTGYFHIIRRRPASLRKVVLTMDNPWLGSIRQHLARVLLRPLLRNVDLVFVPGERGWQYARRLGFEESQICRGLYGVDVKELRHSFDIRSTSACPRSFLFVGRMSKEKNIEFLLRAYSMYREMSSSPWRLRCVGTGPLRALLENREGVESLGFVSPQEMSGIWANASAFILASRYDPWPLSLVEAAAAGLPIIHSNECGSAVEIVRSNYNGFSFSSNSPHQLASKMLLLERMGAQSTEFGKRSIQLALPYSTDAWCDRWEAALGQ